MNHVDKRKRKIYSIRSRISRAFRHRLSLYHYHPPRSPHPLQTKKLFKRPYTL